MTDPSVVGCRAVLVPTLVSFVQLVLDGKIPPSVQPFFLMPTLLCRGAEPQHMVVRSCVCVIPSVKSVCKAH